MHSAPRRLVLLTALLMLPALALAADKTVPVAFAKGATGTTQKGSIAGYDSVNYTLGAKAGQTMTLGLSGSTNVYFNLFAPGSDTAIADAMQAQSFSGALPATGQYRIQVFQPRAQARAGKTSAYSLRIDIAAGTKVAASGSASAGASAAGALPLFNASCPGNLDVHVDAGGPVYLNGKEAALKTFNANYYEARLGATTVSLSKAPDGTLSASYTGAGGANGVCTAK